MGTSQSCCRNRHKQLYKEIKFEQPNAKCGIRNDYLDVEFRYKDLCYPGASRGVKLRPVPVLNGNFIPWDCTNVKTPVVKIPTKVKEKMKYYTVMMIHCCSQDTVIAQGNCFSNDISPRGLKQFYEEATIELDAVKEDKNRLNITEGDKIEVCSCVPPFAQFIHWIKINIPSEKSQLEPKMQGDTVIHYAPLNENMPTKGSGTHRFVFLLFEQEGHIQNRGIVINKVYGGSDIEGLETKADALRRMMDLRNLYDCICEKNVHPDGICARKLYKVSTFAKNFKLGSPIKVNFFNCANY